jgi:hypothetical protein
MADNTLDALVHPYNTVALRLVFPSRIERAYNARIGPRGLAAQTKRSDPSLAKDPMVARRRGEVERQPRSGLSAIVVPAGSPRAICFPPPIRGSSGRQCCCLRLRRPMGPAPSIGGR